MDRLLARTSVTCATVFAVALSCAFGGAGEAVAQGTTIAGSAISQYKKDGYAIKVMNKQVERATSQSTGSGSRDLLTEQFNLAPLPGGDGLPTDSSPDPTKFAPDGKLKSVERGVINDAQVLIQPVAGQRQVNDSEPFKNMLVKGTTDKVSVAAATLNMVDNGAAAGHFAALNFTNNIMQGVLQAHNLQMNLLNATDHSGMQTQAYINRVNQSLVKQNSLPAAIIGSLGDRAEGDIDPLSKIENDATFSIKNLPCANADVAGGSVTVKLSDLLFCKDEASDPNETTQLLAKKADFIRYLGDSLLIETYPLVQTKGPKATRIVQLKKIPPEADSKGRSGLERAKWEEHAVVYEALGAILRGYCTYRTANTNWNKGMWDGKKTPSMILREDIKNLMKMGDGMAWDYASAPDMPLTEGFVEQLFLHVMNASNKVPSAAQCEELAVKAADMPTSIADKNSLSVNDCKVDKGCLRNRLLLYVSDIIARSRALHLYQLVISQTNKFAKTNQYQEWLSQMLIRDFGNAGYFDDKIADNLAALNSYKDLQAKFFQGQIGGSSFLANMESNSPQGFTAGRQ